MDRVQSTNSVGADVIPTVGCLKALLFSERKGGALGQTTVEFALICLPFFIILFAIIDFAEIFFYENSLQNSMREAARFATAGRIIQATNSGGQPAVETNSQGVVVPMAIPDPNNNGREASRYECIRLWFRSNCVLVNYPLTNILVTSATTLPGAPPITSTNAANGDLTLLWSNGGMPTNGPGKANDYIQITATYQVSTITPLMGYMAGYSGFNSTYPVRVSAIVKNEPAYLNFEHTAAYSSELP